MLSRIRTALEAKGDQLVVMLGLTCVLVAVAAAAVAHWRWESRDVFAGEIELPRGIEVLRVQTPDPDAPPSSRRCSAVVKFPADAAAVTGYFVARLEPRGWQTVERSSDRVELLAPAGSGDVDTDLRRLQLVFRRETHRGRTTVALMALPCSSPF